VIVEWLQLVVTVALIGIGNALQTVRQTGQEHGHETKETEGEK